jgi:hypothetical protein
VDQPEALAAAGALSGSKHALFLDFEAEGSALVLRARITALEPALPIVYARTLSTSTSSAALLRSGERLKSAAEARKEYVDALEGRGIYVLPLRIGVRSYASPDQGRSPVSAMPFIWLQLGAEASPTQARAWTGSISAGFSWMPQMHTGWMGQARIGRLLSGPAASLTHPDIYGFFGASVISISGQSALLFQNKVPSLESQAIAILGIEPHATFAAFQFGLEMRLKNRIGAAVFVESLPALADAPAIGSYADLGVITFRSMGAEVSFCF